MHISDREAHPNRLEEPASQRLESWKEIANYLKRGVRTVQRWEKEEDLPVHRHLHDKQGTVYASKSELDVWWKSRPKLQEQPSDVLAGHYRWRLLLPISVAVLIAVAVSAVWWLGRRSQINRASPVRVDSLAVLPFENLSGDPKQEYFADGITEELITELGKIGALRVISRTSIMQYKTVRKSLPQIAEELNVDAVVEGSVLHSGEKVRITAQLIQANTDKHLWSESYELELGDLVTLQDSVGRAVAKAVQRELVPASQSSSSPPPLDPQVHDAYLKGRYYWNLRTDAGLKKSIEFFNSATNRDPTFAPAYAGLADAYSLLSVWGSMSSGAVFPKAKAAALKALELDEGLAEAHTSLAIVKHRFDWDWRGAEEQFRRAIQLNPNYATAHQWYGEFLGDMQRTDEAVRELRQAQQLDPFSSIIGCDLAMALYNGRKYDLAIQEMQKVLEMNPNFPPAHDYLGMFYEAKGSFREAIAESQKAIMLSGGPPGNTLLSVAHTYALSGKRKEAMDLMDEYKRLHKAKEVPAFFMAIVYAGLGDEDRAFKWLERAYQEHAWELVGLKVDPRFDPLRSDPRFQDIVRRVGLPQ